jgi:uncharacterized protein YunC (DUF1805 family)
VLREECCGRIQHLVLIREDNGHTTRHKRRRYPTIEIRMAALARFTRVQKYQPNSSTTQDLTYGTVVYTIRIRLLILEDEESFVLCGIILTVANEVNHRKVPRRDVAVQRRGRRTCEDFHVRKARITEWFEASSDHCFFLLNRKLPQTYWLRRRNQNAQPLPIVNDLGWHCGHHVADEMQFLRRQRRLPNRIIGKSPWLVGAQGIVDVRITLRRWLR